MDLQNNESKEELARQLQEAQWNGEVANVDVDVETTSNSSRDISTTITQPTQTSSSSGGKQLNDERREEQKVVHHRGLVFGVGVIAFLALGVALAALVLVILGMKEDSGVKSLSMEEDPLKERNVALYESLVTKVLEREAFSPIKDERWGETFESRLFKYQIRDRFANAKTDVELYRAVNMLSCARRDTHLDIDPIDGGLGIQPEIDTDKLNVPLRFMADYSGNLNGYMNVSSAAFFVSQKGISDSVQDVQVGDWLVEVNDRPLAEYVEFMIANYRMSTIANGYWKMISDALAEYDPLIEQDYYRDDGTVKYMFRRDPAASGEEPLEYTVTLKYRGGSHSWVGDNPAKEKNLPSYWELISETEDYRLYSPTEEYPHRTLLLEWIDFEEMERSTEELMMEVDARNMTDYDVIIDTTLSSGGSGGPYLIERFSKEPFQSTWGNVRCSDILEDFAKESLGSGDSYNWITDIVLDSCHEGAEYSKNQPFKLRFEDVCEDGILDLFSDRHFTGNSILLTSPEAGSQLDQFTSMWIDNNIGLSMGMPSGGYSNTWEYSEDAEFPTTEGFPAIQFMYSIGHTIRPNGEILEGNPAQPIIPYFLTHENFQTYFSDMILAAQEELSKLRQ